MPLAVPPLGEACNVWSKKGKLLNNVYLFCRAMYSTANCGQTVCARSDLVGPRSNQAVS